MQEFDITDIHVVPVESNGQFEDLSDLDLDFYNSALVYLLNDRKSIYIGESVNIRNRFSNHNAHDSKRNLLNRHAIYSRLFNKSVTLHLEAFLINHFSAEPELKLINANLGNNSHYYHRKREYEELFPQIWDKLYWPVCRHSSLIKAVCLSRGMRAPAKRLLRFSFSNCW